MTVKGTVKEIKGHRCTVAAERPSACEGCANAGLCRSSCLIYVAENTIDARVGDRVVMNVGEDRDILLLSYIFLIPLLIFFGTLLLWSLIKAFSLIFSAVALSVWFFFLRRIDSKKKPRVELLSIESTAGEIR